MAGLLSKDSGVSRPVSPGAISRLPTPSRGGGNDPDSLSASNVDSQTPGDAADLVGVVSRMKYAPLGQGATAHDRFPDTAPGLEMLTRINKCFRKRCSVNSPFKDASGTWLLKAHRVNSRQQQQVVEDYVESICEHGYMPGVRGAAWAQYSPPPQSPQGGSLVDVLGGPPYLMLTADKITTAIRVAHERYPENKNVIDTMANGIDLDLYDYMMGDECATWLCDWSNFFHAGSKQSFMQVLEYTPGVQSAWKAYSSGSFVSFVYC